MSLYAKTGTTDLLFEDLDLIVVVREEPTGSQYDERAALLGSMRIPGSVIQENTNMEDLFSGGELIEVSVDKKALTEYQFRAIFSSMTLPNGKTINKVSDAMAEYRKFSLEAKEQIDKEVDKIWKKHEEDVEEFAASSGNSSE